MRLAMTRFATTGRGITHVHGLPFCRSSHRGRNNSSEFRQCSSSNHQRAAEARNKPRGWIGRRGPAGLRPGWARAPRLRGDPGRLGGPGLSQRHLKSGASCWFSHLEVKNAARRPERLAGDLRAPGRSPGAEQVAAGPAPRPIRGRRRAGLRGTALPSLGLGTRRSGRPERSAGPEARCPRGGSATRPQGRGRRVWQPAMESFRLRAFQVSPWVIRCAISRYCPERPTGRGPSSAVGCARGRRGLSAPRAGTAVPRGTSAPAAQKGKRKSPLELHQMQILCVLRKEKRKEGKWRDAGSPEASTAYSDSGLQGIWLLCGRPKAPRPRARFTCRNAFAAQGPLKSIAQVNS